MRAQVGGAMGGWLVQSGGYSCDLGASALAAKGIDMLILYLSHS